MNIGEVIITEKLLQQEYQRIEESKQITEFEKIGIPFGNERYFEV